MAADGGSIDEPVQTQGQSAPIPNRSSEVERLKAKIRHFSTSIAMSEAKSAETKGGKTLPKHEELLSCLVVMRRLMEDAETESRKLKEEKCSMTARIGSSISAVNKEVEHLKAELLEQDRKISEIASSRVSSACASVSSESQLSLETHELLHDALQSKRKIYSTEDVAKLESDRQCLLKELDELRTRIGDVKDLREHNHQLEHEVERCKEVIGCMKAERKRLKVEKIELQNQMKQLLGTLGDKEAELRDFICNYEQKMRASEHLITRLSEAKDSWENERESIMNKLRDSDEEIAALRAQLEIKEQQVKELEADFLEVKQQLAILHKTLRNDFGGSLEDFEQSATYRLSVSLQRIVTHTGESVINRSSDDLSPQFPRKPLNKADKSNTETSYASGEFSYNFITACAMHKYLHSSVSYLQAFSSGVEGIVVNLHRARVGIMFKYLNCQVRRVGTPNQSRKWLLKCVFTFGRKSLFAYDNHNAIILSPRVWLSGKFAWCI